MSNYEGWAGQGQRPEGGEVYPPGGGPEPAPWARQQPQPTSPNYANEQTGYLAPQQPPPQQSRGGGRALVALLTVLAVVAAGTGVWLLTRGDDGAEQSATPAATGSPADPTESSSASASAQTSAPAQVQDGTAPKSATGLNAAVRDGDFEFTTNKLGCGRTQVGGSTGATAEGQFCVASVLVRNVGDEAKSLSADYQFLYDGQNRRFATAPAALAYVDSSDQVFGRTISPGQFLDGVVIFDVPRDSTPSRLEFHDSQFGDGSTLALPAGSVTREGPVSAVTPTPTPTAPAPEAVPAPGTPSAVWAVFISSSTESQGGAASAAADVARLQAKGYDAFTLYSSNYSSLKPGYHVAAAGPVASEAEAKALARRVRGAGFGDGSTTYPRCVGTAPPCPDPN